MRPRSRGSFRRAAEALYLTQPSLSARVHALEEELGVLLFHRMGRGVRLTEMGRAFLPFAERAMEALRQGRDVIDSARDASGGVLNMASARAIGTYTLPSILEKFRFRYPNIKVHINIGRSSDVLQMVVNEEVQLGLARALTDPDVVTFRLYDEEIALATSPDHPFAVRGEASIYEVAQEPLILYDRESLILCANKSGVPRRGHISQGGDDPGQYRGYQAPCGAWYGRVLPPAQRRPSRGGARQPVPHSSHRGSSGISA